MATKDLVIVVLGIISIIFIAAIIIRNNRETNEQANNIAENQLEVPENSLNNSSNNNRDSGVPSQVEKGDALGGNFMQLEQPEFTIDTSKDYKAVVQTSKGEIVIDLLEKTAPNTVNNFVYLSNEQFYGDVIFHRVIQGFMIQGGDPTGTGTGGPGYKFDDEPFEGEYTRGTVAMANSGPNTNGSQFFIMHADTPLPKNYVIFGKVEKGIEVVDAIATSEVKMSSTGEMSVPVEPTKIESVEIITE